ncbi:hypothetical protein AB0E88_12065 [Streptomyces sp. NPDC028635]|uniref:hypothetical protein n=1 Tax=Streptomyces sp. NPDC028635 TaxID=3154800 RepID=UPI0033EE9B0D
MGTAPARRATWIAAVPTPLEAPVISTWSPGAMRARSASAPYAVVYVSQAAAAVTSSTPSGRGTRVCSGIRTRSP